jgi:hypothetical protein
MNGKNPRGSWALPGVHLLPALRTWRTCSTVLRAHLKSCWVRGTSCRQQAWEMTLSSQWTVGMERADWLEAWPHP